MRVPLATIDGAALRHNLAVVRTYAPNARVMAIIKANAYGHGLLATANALSSDVDAFGVARIEEGLALRAAGIDRSIVLLEGVYDPDEVECAARQRFQIVVHCAEQISLLEESSSAQSFQVWLKLDTGMNRLGFRIEDFADAWARLKRIGPARLRLMTHMASAEARDSDASRAQLDRFNAQTAALGVERSIANSAGLIAWEEARVDWVRPGLMLYGISPLPHVSAQELGLRPAMTLTTQIIGVRRIAAGETVGYNGIWRAQRESVIGIAAVGYGDGYPRGMRQGTPVLVNGREASVVGRVSMDMTAMDVTGLDVRIGDTVTLWGEGLPAERVAPYADTIAYELVCGISQRVTVEWK